MREKVRKVREVLKTNAGELACKKAVIGFDGFVDSVLRVVKDRKNNGEAVCFRGIEEFGLYLASEKKLGGSLELSEQQVKIGGNMPIMSNALGRLGTQVNCIGAMGFPSVREEFAGMRQANCRLTSVCEPGSTLALEFNDGKIMLAQMGALNKLGWGDIKRIVGLPGLLEMCTQSDLIGAVNWGELENASEIWEGLLCDVVSKCPREKSRLIFFDLSDCSKRGRADILNVLSIIRRYKEHYAVVLSMNENEARLIQKHAGGDVTSSSLEQTGKDLFDLLGLEAVVIHLRDRALAWDKEGSYQAGSFFIEKPLITTGGGDNFNAGFCAAQLLGLDMEGSLILANALSSFYVRYGFSPGPGELTDFLQAWELQLLK